MTGIIRAWYPEKGYGFILGSNGRMIFFHVRDWANDDDVVTVNKMVEYDEGRDPKHDKKKATNIRLHQGTETLKAGL